MTNSKEKNIHDEQVSQKNENEKIQKEEVASELTGVTSSISEQEIIDIKDKRIAELESALAHVQQRERDSVLRAKAEVENVRRRSEQDVEKAHKFALERFVFELLPVIDNLERALNMSNKSNIELASTIEGIELTLKSLMNAVRKFGLDVVGDTGVPFNPEVHQAMTMIDSDEYEPNQVIMVMQKGYTLNGRLIRPAMVTVTKTKS